MRHELHDKVANHIAANRNSGSNALASEILDIVKAHDGIPAPDLREAGIADLKAQLAEAKGDLKANAAMLAKQHDRNMELETANARMERLAEVVEKRGCSVTHDREGDADCEHGYPWDCENCPCFHPPHKGEGG